VLLPPPPPAKFKPEGGEDGAAAAEGGEDGAAAPEGDEGGDLEVELTLGRGSRAAQDYQFHLRLDTGKTGGVEPPAEESVEFEIFEGETFGASGVYTTYKDAHYVVEVVDEDGLRIDFDLLPHLAPTVELEVFRSGAERAIHRKALRRAGDDGYFSFETVHPKLSGEYRYVFSATFGSAADAGGGEPLREEKVYVMKTTSARSFVGGALALHSHLRAFEILSQEKYAPTRIFLDLQRPVLAANPLTTDVENLKRGLLAIVAALPRGSLNEGAQGFSEEFREAWESHVLSAGTAVELAEAIVILEKCLNLKWINQKKKPQLSSAAHFLRMATPAAFALRLLALDACINYDKLDAASRRRGRSSASPAPAPAPAAKSKVSGSGRKRKVRTIIYDEEEEDDDEEWNDYGRSAVPQRRAAKKAQESMYKEWSSEEEPESEDFDDEEEEEEEPEPPKRSSKRRKSASPTTQRSSSRSSGGGASSNSNVSSYEEPDVDADDVEGDFDFSNWRGRCSFAIARLRLQNIALPFNTPVDTGTYTDYLDFVERPMDLSKIALRNDEKWYDSYDEILRDVRLMRDNCKRYNGEETLISVHAAQLVTKFTRFVEEAGGGSD